jgi:hypothetical protein
MPHVTTLARSHPAPPPLTHTTNNGTRGPLIFMFLSCFFFDLPLQLSVSFCFSIFIFYFLKMILGEGEDYNQENQDEIHNRGDL